MKFLFLMLSVVLLVSATAASGQNDTTEWKTAYTVGKFLNSEPSKPDQIFKIQYRALNGIVEDFNAGEGGGISALLGSKGDGVLEVRYPRNYPYTNSQENIPGNFIVLNGTYNYDTTNCFFVFSIPFEGNVKIQASWAYQAVNTPFHGDEISADCISQTIVENVPVRKDGTISPLHQFRAGVAAEDISCSEMYDNFVNPKDKEGYHLIINPKGKPYCATDDTIKFLNRVWYK